MNRSNWMLLVIAVAVLAAAAMAWFGRRGDQPTPFPAGEVVAVDVPAIDDAADDALLVEAAFSPDPDEQESAGEIPDEFHREQALPDAPVAERLVVQVWNRKRGEPATEAEVFVLREAIAQDGDPFAPHRIERVFARGRRYTASTDGRVEIEPIQDRALIAARLPGAVGLRELRRGHRPLEQLTLQADESITVRVVDDRGRPVAFAPVAIRQQLVERVDVDRVRRQWKDVQAQLARLEKFSKEDAARAAAYGMYLERLQRRHRQLAKEMEVVRQAERRIEQAMKKAAAAGKPIAKGKRPTAASTRMEIRSRRRTDSTGRAVFSHLQLQLADNEKWWPKAQRDHFEAALLVDVEEPVVEPFAGRPLPEQEIVLRMPPTGTVVLHTVDLEGQPFEHPVRGELRAVGGDGTAWTRLPIRKPEHEAEIVFAFVGIGRRFAASCRLDDDDFRWVSPQFDGPQQAGERVDVDLVVAPGAGMLRGRLLDQAGLPLDGERVTFLINSRRGRLEGEEVVVAADGSFHLPYKIPRGHEGPFRLQIRQESRQPVGGIARTFPALPEGRVVDLGDVVLSVHDCLARGYVVDDRGEPVVGATVQLQREREVGRRAGELRFVDEAFNRARSDGDGAFLLFGDAGEAGRYRLRVTARGHLPYESVGVPGARQETVIRLVRQALLLGDVVLPDWLDPRRVQVELQSASDPSKLRRSRIRGGKRRRRIVIGGLTPGIYNLLLRIEGFPDPFVRVDNIELLPGQRDPHPRLLQLDLSNSLFRYVVRAVDQDGKRVTPKAPLLANVLRPDGQYAWIGVRWRKGRAEVISADSSLTVMAVAQGRRAASVQMVPGEGVLTFHRTAAVSLRAAGLRKLVADEPVWLALQPIDELGPLQWDRDSRRLARDFRRSANGYGRVRRDDVARIATAIDGSHRVVAYVGDKRRGGPVEVRLGEVQVRAATANVPIEVSVPAGRIRAALQELAQRRANGAAGR